MEDCENGENSRRELPPLQIDPKCLKDALRVFFQPIKNDDPRLDFYTMYKREATEYDVAYVKKYDEDLNTTLIFAGLFCAVSSAFIVDMHSKLQPDPNDQSAAILRAILLTLNHSAIPDESPSVSLVQQGPPNEIITATGLLYASLLISLLAAFVAMLGKQWLNRYLRHAGGSVIERCGDRQRKCDGLQKWPFHFFVESLPVMLQVSLLLLACGLCRYMISINTTVAHVLIAFTILGVLFYLGIVVAGASSYECPFQTPACNPLRTFWAEVRPRLISMVFPIITALRILGVTIRHYIFCITTHFHGLSDRIRLAVSRVGLFFSQTGLSISHHLRQPPLPTFRHVPHPSSPPRPTPWFTLNELAMIQAANADDARCASWVLRNITDPEALDAAIRLAETIHWFEDGIDTCPPYDLIVSAFHACFGSNREVYPGLRDKAYHAGRAILWIHTLAVCKSEEFARIFPLPTIQYTAPAIDCDLTHLLGVNAETSTSLRFAHLLRTDKGHTPSHLQWISNVLLHLSWATQPPENFSSVRSLMSSMRDINTPLDVTLNHFLMCCNFLGAPIKEEALKIQDKSDRLEQALDQVSRAIISALNTTHPLCEVIQEILYDLTKWENHPLCLTGMAYRWCAVIWQNRQNLQGWETLLLLSLQVGFRHIDPQDSLIVDLAHTKHHQEFVNTVFEGSQSEAVADLLCALSLVNASHRLSHPLANISPTYIIDLRRRVTLPLSLRLRQLFISSIEFIGFKRFEEAGAESFVELLNDLCIGIEDVKQGPTWTSILLETTQFPEGVQSLDLRSWELLAELTTAHSWILEDATYSPYVTSSLLKAEEWDKLECWVGVVWMVWPPTADGITEDLRHTTLSLFRRRPRAVPRLTLWVEQWSKECEAEVPEVFCQVCEQGREEATSTSPSGGGSEEAQRSSSSSRSLPSRGRNFWASLPMI